MQTTTFTWYVKNEGLIRKKANWIEKFLKSKHYKKSIHPKQIAPFKNSNDFFSFNLPSTRTKTKSNSVPKKGFIRRFNYRLFIYKKKAFARIRTVVIGIELLVNSSLRFGDRYHLLVGFKHVKGRTIERGFGIRPRIVFDLDRPDEKRFGAPLYLRSICRKISSVVNCGILTNCPSVRL